MMVDLDTVGVGVRLSASPCGDEKQIHILNKIINAPCGTLKLISLRGCKIY